jgi:GxxExxY protein
MTQSQSKVRQEDFSCQLSPKTPMPITCRDPLTPLTRQTFGSLSYDIFGDILAIRQELGRFFDEKHYKRALALRRQDVKVEVPVTVSYQTFEKRYFLDALVAAGALIEFKATETLTPRHRAQALHHQMLTGLECGMLINVRPEAVSKEYVNCLLHPAERYKFHFTVQNWPSNLPGAATLYDILAELLHEWGNCLDTPLYEEALTHFLGGESAVLRPVKVHFDGTELGEQVFRLAAERIAFKLTAFDTEAAQTNFAPHAYRLLAHAELDALLWVNLGRHEITFRSLKTGS